ncbi:MAG: hypothetical protein CM15mP98_06470 [Paracoccaceae bacterium]|nr:MAG: hypothetical protein CM15mP98_06470 [Paracoccaceae bacterium]
MYGSRFFAWGSANKDILGMMNKKIEQNISWTSGVKKRLDSLSISVFLDILLKHLNNQTDFNVLRCEIYPVWATFFPASTGCMIMKKKKGFYFNFDKSL